MTAREQIDAVIARVRELNGRRDEVYARLMEKLEEQGVRLVDFRKIGRQESERLERYFDSEIAPLISPSIVGRRQPFPFLRNKDIYAVVVLEGKKGKYKLGIIPCSAGVFPRLIEVSASEKTYMLAEDLILHFIPKVFEGYVVKAKSLMRVTRNADIDADALYDDDLDYREFMVQLIKRRKRLAPVRLELSRELDGIIVDTLCRYMDVPREYVFHERHAAGFLVPLWAGGCAAPARRAVLSSGGFRRNPRRLSPAGRFWRRFAKRTSCFPILTRA